MMRVLILSGGLLLSSVAMLCMFTCYSWAAGRQENEALLGSPSHVQLTVSDIITSLAWYAKLGFTPVKGPVHRPDSIVYLSDGQVVLALVTGNAPSPMLVMRASNLRALRDSLDQLEIASGHTLRGPTFSELQVTSPAGLYMSIRLASDEDSIAFTRAVNPTCGHLGELSIATPSLPSERTFWEQLGWKQVDGGDTPYPFAIMSDGTMKIGIHQGLDLPSAVLTYFSNDAADRIARLKGMGLRIEHDIVDGSQARENAALKSPDGQLVFVFKDPKAK